MGCGLPDDDKIYGEDFVMGDHKRVSRQRTMDSVEVGNFSTKKCNSRKKNRTISTQRTA